MTVSAGYFNQGETVTYNGRRAKVVSNNWAENSVTILIDGKLVKADMNDLFGINKSINTWNESNEKWIKKHEAALNGYKESYNLFSELEHDANMKIADFKAAHEVFSKPEELQNWADRKEYKELCAKQESAHIGKRRASWDIQSTALALFSEYCSKMKNAFLG